VLVLALSLALTGNVSTSYAKALEPMSYNGVSYVSGGIGLGERQKLETMSKDYNLKLVFAIQKGNFLADVKVMITNGGGHTVLEATSEGPWLFAKLTPGTYNISATVAGKTIQKVVQVRDGGHSQLSFVWMHG
jgi:hypothetical protein